MRRFLRRLSLLTKQSWRGVGLHTNWNTDLAVIKLIPGKKETEKGKLHGLTHPTAWTWRIMWARNS
jgi:hypothetical protein